MNLADSSSVLWLGTSPVLGTSHHPEATGKAVTLVSRWRQELVGEMVLRR